MKPDDEKPDEEKQQPPDEEKKVIDPRTIKKVKEDRKKKVTEKKKVKKGKGLWKKSFYIHATGKKKLQRYLYPSLNRERMLSNGARAFLPGAN